LVAYEIHDGFAQQLAGAVFRLQGFRKTCVQNPEEAWETFDEALRLICRAMDDTRRLISSLRPPVLDESGIVEAIEYLVCEFEGHVGPRIEFVHDISFQRLAPPLEAAIFRIVQESLRNACRHSGSDRVRVELIQREQRLHVDVCDWGVGFSVENVEEQRFGLQGIRERVRLLGGRVVIDSAPGKGTHISVELPLTDQLPHLCLKEGSP
jgi:two-component system, NarL family, sensor histidine kinase DegS